MMFLSALFASLRAHALVSDVVVLRQVSFQENVLDFKYGAMGNAQEHTPVVSVLPSVIKMTSGGEVIVEVTVKISDKTPQKPLNKAPVEVRGSVNLSDLTKDSLKNNFPDLKASYVWISKVNLPPVTLRPIVLE